MLGIAGALLCPSRVFLHVVMIYRIVLKIASLAYSWGRFMHKVVPFGSLPGVRLTTQAENDHILLSFFFNIGEQKQRLAKLPDYKCPPASSWCQDVSDLSESKFKTSQKVNPSQATNLNQVIAVVIYLFISVSSVCLIWMFFWTVGLNVNPCQHGENMQTPNSTPQALQWV